MECGGDPVRLTGVYYTLNKRTVSVTVRVVTSGVPSGGQISVTDLQLQKGTDVSGLTINQREAGTSVGGSHYRNGVVNGDMVIGAMSNLLVSAPVRAEVQAGNGNSIRAGDMRFGTVQSSAYVDGKTHSSSQGWGRAPIVTERQDLRMSMNVGVTEDEFGEPLPGARTHLRLSWDERVAGELTP